MRQIRRTENYETRSLLKTDRSFVQQQSKFAKKWTYISTVNCIIATNVGTCNTERIKSSQIKNILLHETGLTVQYRRIHTRCHILLPHYTASHYRKQ